MFGILEKTTVFLHQNLRKKKNRPNLLNYRGARPKPPPPYTPVFVEDYVPYTPYKGFCPQSLDERQLIEIRIK